LPEEGIGLCGNKSNEYFFEISFVDSEELIKQPKERRKRFFFENDRITIVDKSYLVKLEQLKNQGNLMPEEKANWRY
jgi:hypothetical protein